MGKRTKSLPFRTRALALVVCFTLFGCGKPDATVSGKITYRSRTLTRGEISFVAADGQSASSTIHADGCYQVTKVPQGAVTVIVSSVGAESDSELGVQVPSEAPKRISLVPEKYNDLATTPLHYSIVSGSQKIDINLED